MHEFENNITKNEQQIDEEIEEENNYDNIHSSNTESSISSQNSLEEQINLPIDQEQVQSSHFIQEAPECQFSSDATSSVSSTTSISAEDQIKPVEHFTVENSEVKEHLHAESITDFDRAEQIAQADEIEVEGEHVEDDNRHVLEFNY